MWNATVEEGRERRLLHLPFTLGVDVIALSKDTCTDAVSLGEATLKVFFSQLSNISAFTRSADGNGYAS